MSESSAYALRLTSGSPMISAGCTVLPSVAVVVSTSGGAALTVTVSLDAPTASAGFRVCVSSTARTIFCCKNFLKALRFHRNVVLAYRKIFDTVRAVVFPWWSIGRIRYRHSSPARWLMGTTAPCASVTGPDDRTGDLLSSCAYGDKRGEK